MLSSWHEVSVVEKTAVQKLARILRVLVLVIFVCNIIALIFVPGLLNLSYDDLTGEWRGDFFETLVSFVNFWHYEWDSALANLFDPVMITSLWWYAPYIGVLTVFLWTCGICTAVILWQGKRVLDTILAEEPFSMKNAANLKRAAVCCFIISGVALVRLIWGFVYYQTIWPLLTYNALFVPIFLIGGLLFLVMSALFRQAAELKAENDLTI